MILVFPAVSARAEFLYQVEESAPGQPGTAVWDCRLRTPDGTRYRTTLCFRGDRGAPDVRALAEHCARYPQDWTLLP